jgi:hypothetical protein
MKTQAMAESYSLSTFRPHFSFFNASPILSNPFSIFCMLLANALCIAKCRTGNCGNLSFVQ